MFTISSYGITPLDKSMKLPYIHPEDDKILLERYLYIRQPLVFSPPYRRATNLNLKIPHFFNTHYINFDNMKLIFSYVAVAGNASQLFFDEKTKIFCNISIFLNRSFVNLFDSKDIWLSFS